MMGDKNTKGAAIPRGLERRLCSFLCLFEVLMAAVSASCQILAIPFYILSSELKDKSRGSA